jgi:hypothetical protein
MNFNTPEARRILRLEENVRDIKEKLVETLQHKTDSQYQPQMGMPQYQPQMGMPQYQPQMGVQPQMGMPQYQPQMSVHTQPQMSVHPQTCVQQQMGVPQMQLNAKKRKTRCDVFNNVGMGKRVTLHPVSAVTQAVERAKRLLVYKRRLAKLKSKVNKHRKVNKRRKLRKNNE